MTSTRFYRLDPFRSTLLAAGPDAQSFLQGQLSSDIRRLDEACWQFSSHNTPKGRMLACPIAWRSPQGYHLEVPSGLAQPLTRRLKMFVLRSRLSLTDSPEAAVALSGPGCAELLQGAGLPCPAQAFGLTSHGSLTLLRRLSADTVSVHGPADQIETLAQRWASGVAEGSVQDWAVLEIEAGIPQVFPETQDQFIPQMANLDRLGGIGFEKGCYTGQEIVARLHYLGQLKRRLFLCSGSGTPPRPGAQVHRGSQDSQAVGSVVQAGVTGPGQFVASVILPLGDEGADDLISADATFNPPRAYRYPGELS